MYSGAFPLVSKDHASWQAVREWRQTRENGRADLIKQRRGKVSPLTRPTLGDKVTMPREAWVFFATLTSENLRNLGRSTRSSPTCLKRSANQQLRQHLPRSDFLTHRLLQKICALYKIIFESFLFTVFFVLIMYFVLSLHFLRWNTFKKINWIKMEW